MTTTTSTYTTTSSSTTTTTRTTTTSFTTTTSSSTSSTTHSTSTTTTTAPNAGFCLFRNVTIPYNSRILKAVVEFTGYAPSDGIDTDVQCHFEDADNSSPPSDKADLDTRELTSGVPWKNIEEWKDNYSYQTPQLKDILQTVINRAGWVSGNNILFTAKNDGLDSYRLWSAIEHRGGIEKARLKVSWIAPKKLDPPVILPEETFQLSAFDCSISAYPEDANIYYTLDGSNPNQYDTLYTGPFEISINRTVKARAYKNYWTYSDIASKAYTFYSGDGDFSSELLYTFGFGEAMYPLSGYDMKIDSSGYVHIVADVISSISSPRAGKVIYITNTSGSFVTETIRSFSVSNNTYTLNAKIVLDSNDKPHVAYRYYGAINGLGYAQKTGASWNYTETSVSFDHLDIALNSSDAPFIFIVHGSSKALYKYAVSGGSLVLNATINIGTYSYEKVAAAIDSSGKDHIMTVEGNYFRYWTNTPGIWSTFTVYSLTGSSRAYKNYDVFIDSSGVLQTFIGWEYFGWHFQKTIDIYVASGWKGTRVFYYDTDILTNTLYNAFSMRASDNKLAMIVNWDRGHQAQVGLGIYPSFTVDTLNLNPAIDSMLVGCALTAANKLLVIGVRSDGLYLHTQL